MIVFKNAKIYICLIFYEYGIMIESVTERARLR